MAICRGEKTNTLYAMYNKYQFLQPMIDSVVNETTGSVPPQVFKSTNRFNVYFEAPQKTVGFFPPLH